MLPQGFGWVFGSGEVGSREEERVRTVARECVNQLRERVLQELPLLPFGGEQQAQALVDARVNRYARCGQATRRWWGASKQRRFVTLQERQIKSDSQCISWL